MIDEISNGERWNIRASSCILSPVPLRRGTRKTWEEAEAAVLGRQEWRRCDWVNAFMWLPAFVKLISLLHCMFCLK